MTLPKKGSRTIEVDGTLFRYTISRIKPKSDWREEIEELDTNFMRYAKRFGLGNVCDATINITIQSAHNSASSMFIKCHTLIVDGFLGPEQLIQIKPNQISQLIRKSLKDGWKPNIRGDFKLELAQKWVDEKNPVMLQLPGMNETIDNYDNIERPIKINLED